MATRKRRTRQDDGTFKSDNPATPEVNEAWEDAPAAEEAAVEEAQAPEEAAAVEEPAVEPEAPVAVETPAAAEVPNAAPLADMLAEKRKDPEKEEKDPGLKPMTEERLAEIRQNAVTAASIEKAGVDQIIKDAGVEKTRGREIAARLMFNARQKGGFV
jgi:hypothetical protein